MVVVGPDEPLDESSIHPTEANVVRITDEEAAQLDLLSLITRFEWRHVMNRMKVSPHEAKKKQVVNLDGGETTSYPLHLAVSKKPPVRQ
jgi:hypothetical protein